MIEWEKYAPKNKSSTSKFRNEFPHRKEAEELAKKGRFGDTMIMHVNPEEVEFLAKFAPGGITINPETGQPEAFLQILAGIIPAIMTAVSSIGPALATGIGAIGTGLGAVGGAASSVLGSIGSGIGGLFGAGSSAAAPSTVLATVPTTTAEAALASASTPAWMSGSGTPFMSALGMDATGAALPGSFSTLGSGGAAFTPAALPGSIPTGIAATPAQLAGPTTQFPGLASVPAPNAPTLNLMPNGYSPPGMDASMWAELQQAKATQGLSSLNPANAPGSLNTANPTLFTPNGTPIDMNTPLSQLSAPTGQLPPGAINHIPPGTHGPMPNSITLGGNPAGTPPINPVTGGPLGPNAPGFTPVELPSNFPFSNAPGGPNAPGFPPVELPPNLGDPLTIGERIAGMSNLQKAALGIGAYSMISDLASDDPEEEEREPYENSWKGTYHAGWNENPQAANSRRSAVGPGGSPYNKRPRYYGGGIG